MALGPFNAGDPLALIREKFNALVAAVVGMQSGKADLVGGKVPVDQLPSLGGGGGPVGIGDVSGLTAALAAKAEASVLPTKADLVNGKVPAAQLPVGGGGSVTLPIAMTDVSGLPSALGAKADLVNGKVPASQLPAASGGGVTLPIAISDVTNLQSSLDGKAPTAHTHAVGDVTGLQSALDGKAAASHTHTAAQISDATAAGRNLLTAASAAAQRTALALGTAATASTGTAAGNVVALDGSGRLPAVDGSQLTGIASGGAALPSGLIAMWSGAANVIPSGWVLCDGQNGAPDLRNRFVIGAGSTYGVGAVGGSATHTHTVGNTALSEAQMPSHTHAVSDPGHNHNYARHFNVQGVPTGSATNVLSSTGESSAYTTGSRTTGISLASTGSGQAHGHTLTTDTVLPPYYALCFIMKT